MGGNYNFMGGGNNLMAVGTIISQGWGYNLLGERVRSIIVGVCMCVYVFVCVCVLGGGL